MKSLAKIFALFIFLLAATHVSAQKDSSHRDTLALYKKIKKIAYKTKFTKALYHSIFVDPAPQKYEVISSINKTADKKKSKGELKGIIRSINIIVYDPFGYSVNDTNKRDIEFLQKGGNKLHITSRKRIIKNLLLFKESDSLDILKLNESEQILRSMPYINDARIYLSPQRKNDSIDVTIVVKDKWSIEVFGDISPSQGNLTIRDINIAGSGQRYEQLVSEEFNVNYEIAGKYFMSSISKSHANAEIFYSLKKDLTQTGIAIERPFYSSLTKWAGGFLLTETISVFSLNDSTLDTETKFPVNNIFSDEWIARSIQLGKRRNYSTKIKNLILSARYSETHFLQRPSFSIDTSKTNSNSKTYLGSIGFSLNRYYKVQYIFRFGANEDIPEGLIIHFTSGILYKEGKDLTYYTGTDISQGKHFENFGYLSFRAAFGNYFNKSHAVSSNFNLGFIFFTDLIRNNHWYYRQFLYMKYVTGINKPQNEKAVISPDELYGMPDSPSGKSKILLNLEGVTYTPYNLIGFRFAPLLLIGFGIIENTNAALLKGNVFQSYAAGLLMRNENFLTSSFEISYGFYPAPADGNENAFKYNPVTRFTIKFRNFSIEKPALISYE